ncbi:MAG TPA: ATP-binding protein [Thermodesulfobacteriota bacterium]
MPADRPEHGRRARSLCPSRLAEENRRLREQVRALEQRLRRRDEQRRAMLHIMSDLHETTAEVRRREQELRDKQEQLVQAAKLATLGELTTGVAHELNNPLNNIGLFVGNAIDQVEMGLEDRGRVLGELRKAMQQVRKATEIISHLRTFGRAAPATRGPIAINDVIERALSLVQEQFRLRQIEVALSLGPPDARVVGNAIQLEQVVINLLTNARDAVAASPRKLISITGTARDGVATLAVEDTGPGIPKGLERRIFDPFFTTKEVGAGTGLGLSITYGIVKAHEGTIRVVTRPGAGATFVVELPLAGGA